MGPFSSQASNTAPHLFRSAQAGTINLLLILSFVSAIYVRKSVITYVIVISFS
jgi:hypothetical protein